MWPSRWVFLCCPLVVLVLCLGDPARADWALGAEQTLQADGHNLVVAGYSVPSFVDWDNDGLMDLVVGQGGGTATEGKVRVYRNTGTTTAPLFTTYVFVQANGADLSVVASGCLGIYPRVVYWDGDARKDLLAGEAGGKVRLYTNTGTDAAPSFDAGVYLQVGQPGQKTDIAVGGRATPNAVDWNGDGRKDLVVGALDGRLRIYLNEGTDTSPDFRTVAYAQDSGVDLIVSTGRSSPSAVDLDGDGAKDLLTGNTEGELLFYHNFGSDAAPGFSGFVFVEAEGIPIDLAGSARSRPFVCDYNDDQTLDVLLGSGDGLVRLYEGEGGGGAVSPIDATSTPVVRWLPGLSNPVNGGERARLELTRGGRVRIDLLRVDGSCAVQLLNQELSAGVHSVAWPATDASGRAIPRGVYYLLLQSKGARDVRSIVVTR